MLCSFFFFLFFFVDTIDSILYLLLLYTRREGVDPNGLMKNSEKIEPPSDQINASAPAGETYKKILQKKCKSKDLIP